MSQEFESPRCCKKIMTAFGYRQGWYQFQCFICGKIIVSDELKRIEKTGRFG